MRDVRFAREASLDQIIRPVTEADAPQLLAYAVRLFAEDLPGIFRRPTPTLDDEVALIRASLEHENGTLLVAEAEERIVGLVRLMGEQLPEEAHAATFAISVDRDWRGRGLGTQLMDAMLAWASAHGITRVQGFVWDTNPRALAFYEGLGFEREGVCRRAVIRDGQPIDVILIARLLDTSGA